MPRRTLSRSHTATTRPMPAFMVPIMSSVPIRPQPICATWMRLLGESAANSEPEKMLGIAITAELPSAVFRK